MENIIHETAKIISLSFEENLNQMLASGGDISEFVLATKKSLNEVGVLLVAEALETLDSLVREDRLRKRNWHVKEKAAPNTLATIFGTVHYQRTYYKNKMTGEYEYLSDRKAGIGPYDKMDLSLKAKLIRDAAEMPYRKSGTNATDALEMSGQSVMNAIREIGHVENEEAPFPEEKRQAKVLYIEADEDHVALQTGGCAEPKLVYVHEGLRRLGKNRLELVNPRYFGGMYHSSEDLWTEVSDYIELVYDIDSIQKIYLSGDRAGWIRNGRNFIAKNIYVPDKFHMKKYVKKAACHIENAEREIWKAIRNQDRNYLKVIFDTIESDPKSDGKKETITAAKKYIFGSFKDAVHYYDEDYCGCSAEGHVSHLFSSRLSSRPLGWSRIGVDEMARIRIYLANGGNIYHLMLKKKQEAMKSRNIENIDKRVVQTRLKVACGEMLHNIEILNTGKRISIQKALKAYRGY